jgi:hypothetical protein
VDPWGWAGSGGAYIFEHEQSGSYIGKGEEGRMQQSITERTTGPTDKLLGAAHVSTNGDNDLGKMVEYKTMVDSGFDPSAGREGVPDGFLNKHTSGKSTWDANPSKQVKATELSNELLKKFGADKIARAAGKCT